MALNDIAHGAVNKKTTLMNTDLPRFGVRAILAGVYLTLATGFAAVGGGAVEALAPGLGGIIFSFLFGFGLFVIVILNADLATGNMMFGCYGATTKQISWPMALKFALVTTLFNLVGAIIVALLLAVSAKYQHMDNTHFLMGLVEGKLAKSWWGAMIEGIGANFVVNMAIIGALYAKDFASKFTVIVPTLAIFVGLSLEHVIANFSLMSIATAVELIDGGAAFDGAVPVAAIAWNWLWVWIGNFIGGGVLIGSVYAWLNKGPEVYRD
ncbi:formate/nitrite transporter family protein [Corynebacterium uterequi]|uniref:Formate/nitrite transporter family protein n=1 Tax=Corynebacterium uterequi TaxID=1072256 RepID=A0A0G3HAL0_9CORY|nr:formate/nitrite transporter family protein [Corynebacterium uterequi]AKK10374.1 formate/nitrite transporter family protein [Corynebacterium uterequi]